MAMCSTVNQRTDMFEFNLSTNHCLNIHNGLWLEWMLESIALCSGVPQIGEIDSLSVFVVFFFVLFCLVDRHHFKPLWFKIMTNYERENKGGA